MRLITRGPGPHADVGVSGAIVTVGGNAYNTEERQGQSTQLIDLRESAGKIAEGGKGFQVATIEIPPARTEEVDTGNVDEDGNPVMELNQIPLDPDLVTVTLWTIQK